MSRVTYWDTMQRYFIAQGIPHQVIATFCIRPVEAAQISDLIARTRPRTILEVGTFIGMSTGVIALASANIPECRIVCVDPNFPVGPFIALYLSHLHLAEERRTLDFVHPMLTHFGQEQRVTIREGFFSHLSPWMKDRVAEGGNGSPEQVTVIGEQIGEDAPFDLAFIDGDHETSAVYHDLLLVQPFMAPHGIIVLHDVSEYWGARVCAGVDQFIQQYPEYSFKASHNLGFLSMDTEKAWLPSWRNPPLLKVRRKLAALAKRW